jgi:hypothetical protein
MYGMPEIMIFKNSNFLAKKHPFFKHKKYYIWKLHFILRFQESSCLDNSGIRLHEFCKKKDYEIVDIYEDIISGAAPKRPE